MTDIGRAVAHLERGEWEAAHAIVQDLETPAACWAHGIVHLMEGDDGNAGYWYRRAGRALDDVRLRGARQDCIAAEVAALRATL